MQTTLVLRNVVPRDFFIEYMETPTAEFIDVEVIGTFGTSTRPWPGPHKYVHVWWLLANDHAVGWNENPALGWSFPVIKVK